MLGKSSLMGKSNGSLAPSKQSSSNDFEPRNLKKNNSEKMFLDRPEVVDQNTRTSEGAKREQSPMKEIPHPTPEIKWKTIFKSQILPMSIFEEDTRSVNAPWIVVKSEPEPVKTVQKEQTKYDSNLSTGHSNQESGGSQVEGGSGFSQQSPPVQVEPPAPVKEEVQPAPPKQPVTIESIFKKYRKQNKTVTKIVHKKNQGRTEKWVYFSDGTSVLEDPGEPPAPPPVEQVTASKPGIYNDFSQSGVNDQWAPNQGNQFGNNSQMQPSNVYFYDHTNLVAEFDPENPNNIAMTLYEITTLQQKHMYCKYFEPAIAPKFNELASVVDYSSPGNPSVYHQLDHLNDEHLLEVKKEEEEPKMPAHYWTKSLRKSNKRLISKKKNKIISKKNTRLISN